MMLLGVVIHSAAAYCTLPEVWWLKDPETSQWMDALIVFLHAFRLPAFFVMAGFFAAMLHERRGWQGMLENRMARLGWPLFLGVLVMFPFLKLSSVYLHFVFRDAQPLARTLEWMGRGRLEQTIEPMHLWFLIVLIWMVLFGAAGAKWLNRLEGGWFARMIVSWWRLPVLTFVTFLTLLPMEVGILDTPKLMVPVWRVQAAYGVFFAVGWGMWRNRERLQEMARGGWRLVITAILLQPFVVAALMRVIPVRSAPPAGLVAIIAFLTALTAWLMFFGLLSLFLRHASRPSPRARYWSDAAYWIYLFHPPVLVLLQAPMMFAPLTPWVKFVLGIAGAVPILVWTYDAWVRNTWLGVMLNGRRYPRGVEQPEPLPAAEPAAG
jgi:hypothetical protein